MKKIELGQRVLDVLTGVEGIAVARTEYLTGCANIGIRSPLDKDGKVPEVYWTDELRIKVIDEKKIKLPGDIEEPKVKGGPQDHPPSRNH